MMLFDSPEQQANLRSCVEAAARGLAFDASEAAFATATVLVELRRAIDGGGLVSEFFERRASAASSEVEPPDDLRQPPDAEG